MPVPEAPVPETPGKKAGGSPPANAESPRPTQPGGHFLSFSCQRTLYVVRPGLQAPRIKLQVLQTEVCAFQTKLHDFYGKLAELRTKVWTLATSLPVLRAEVSTFPTSGRAPQTSVRVARSKVRIFASEIWTASNPAQRSGSGPFEPNEIIEMPYGQLHSPFGLTSLASWEYVAVLEPRVRG